MNKKITISILFLFLLILPLNEVCAKGNFYDGVVNKCSDKLAEFTEKTKEKVKNFFSETTFENPKLKKFAEEHPELDLDEDFYKLSQKERRIIYGKIAVCAVAAIVVPCAVVWVARKIYKKLTANEDTAKEEDSEKEKNPSSSDTPEAEKESEK